MINKLNAFLDWFIWSKYVEISLKRLFMSSKSLL